MSRYRGPKLKIQKRLGLIPGLTSSKLLSKSKSDSTLPKKSSQYGIRLKAKQKIRYHYGISERGLIKYVKKARQLKGSTGELLLQLLEMRLDNILFRSGLTITIPAARQLISHGHIRVNGLSVNIPSYQCKANDYITVEKEMKEKISLLGPSTLPSHLDLKDSLYINVLGNVSIKEIGVSINELLIIEYYSRN